MGICCRVGQNFSEKGGKTVTDAEACLLDWCFPSRRSNACYLLKDLKWTVFFWACSLAICTFRSTEPYWQSHCNVYFNKPGIFSLKCLTQIRFFPVTVSLFFQYAAMANYLHSVALLSHELSHAYCVFRPITELGREQVLRGGQVYTSCFASSCSSRDLRPCRHDHTNLHMRACCELSGYLVRWTVSTMVFSFMHARIPIVVRCC
jgi:hypothetical protein